MISTIINWSFLIFLGIHLSYVIFLSFLYHFVCDFCIIFVGIPVESSIDPHFCYSRNTSIVLGGRSGSADLFNAAGVLKKFGQLPWPGAKTSFYLK
jgi:hypothetical protein